MELRKRIVAGILTSVMIVSSIQLPAGNVQAEGLLQEAADKAIVAEEEEEVLDTKDVEMLAVSDVVSGTWGDNITWRLT